MGSSILGIGQSALAAAQAGLATTGHNIANANTPGYSRQLIVQASAGAQNTGFGFVGKGTSVVDVRRVYDDLLAGQVRSAQSAQNQVQTYYTQISSINNQLADTTAGLSPVLQDFFKGVQDLASNPNAAASRQAALSSGEALAARFQSLNGQMQEVADSVNSQIQASITTINVNADQIAKLNDAIEKAQGSGDGKVSNDLLDQRDLAVDELSKEIKTTVVKQGNSYNVFIGNGQPLVIGTKTFQLVPQADATDPSRTEVGYRSNGQVVSLSESTLTGGKLGGLFDFRANSMDSAQNALGRVAIGLAMTFNAQHRLGVDQNGTLGGDFFVAASPRIEPSGLNNKAPAAAITAGISDPNKLTTSDYRLKLVSAGNYVVTRMSDNVDVYGPGAFPSGADAAIPGVTLTETTAMTVGDEFVIRPTVDGAAEFAVAIKDVTKIAAGAPIRTAVPTTNTGSGKISAGTVNSFNDNVTIKFSSGTAFDVVDNTTGVTLASNVAYTAGANIDYNGWRVKISGAPVANDTFVIDHAQASTTSAAGTITAPVPTPPNTQFAPDPYLQNGIQVVFDSSSSYHLVGTSSNVTGASSITGGTFAPALAAGANPGIVVTGGAATIGTGGAGAYTATGTKTTIAGGTITDTGGGTFSISGATLIVEGGSNQQSTSFTGLTVTIDAAGTITIPATASNTQIASTFNGTPATGLAFTANANNDLSVNGWTVQMTGAPNSGDTFTIGANNNGVGDNRNAVLLGGLQSANTLANGTSSYQGAYAQLVSQVGNKTRELEVTNKAESSFLEQAQTAQQAQSGVNLDEEATNLLRYQQAYQAAAKVMSTAGQLFDLLLNLGN